MLGLVVAEVVAVVVRLVVTLLVGVVVVSDVDAVVVPVVVADEVGVVVVVGEVVKLLVPVVDALLVGVVASQLRNAPFWYACVTLFRAAAVAPQALLSNSKWPNAHPTSSPAPSGPLYSLSRALTAAAVVLQEVASTSTLLAPHLTVPDGIGQLRRTRLSITACASQPKLLRTDRRAGTPVVQKNAPSNTVVVWVVVAVVVVVGVVVWVVEDVDVVVLVDDDEELDVAVDVVVDVPVDTVLEVDVEDGVDVDEAVLAEVEEDDVVLDDAVVLVADVVDVLALLVVLVPLVVLVDVVEVVWDEVLVRVELTATGRAGRHGGGARRSRGTA